MLTFGAMAYLFFVDGESFGGWTAFFISMALTILFHKINEQDKQIRELRDEKQFSKNKSDKN